MTRRHTQVGSGFTLLETILAVALSAVLMGLIAGGLQVYTQIVADRNADVINSQLARAVLHRITADLQAAIYEEPEEDESLAPEGDLGGGLSATATETSSTSAGTTATNSGTASEGSPAESGTSADLTTSSVATVPGLFGTLTELRIDVQGTFPHPLRYDAIVDAGGDPLVENLTSVDRVITYYLRTSSASELAGTPLESPDSRQNQQTMILIRRVQKRAEAELDAAIGGGTSASAGEQLLSDQVVGLEFNYHDGYDWTDSWDSEEMGGLPIAVQITVTIADPGDDQSVISEDNIFQAKVALPTAVIPDDTTSGEAY